jgi:hypothetical protein
VVKDAAERMPTGIAYQRAKSKQTGLIMFAKALEWSLTPMFLFSLAPISSQFEGTNLFYK